MDSAEKQEIPEERYTGGEDPFVAFDINLGRNGIGFEDDDREEDSMNSLIRSHSTLSRQDLSQADSDLRGLQEIDDNNDSGSGSASERSGEPPVEDGTNRAVACFPSGTEIHVETLALQPGAFTSPIFIGETDTQMVSFNQSVIIKVQTEALAYSLPSDEYEMPHQQVRVALKIAFIVKKS